MDFALGVGYTTGQSEDPSSPYYNPLPASEVLITGDTNTAPVVSDTPQSSGITWSGLHNLLGSIGTTARDVGSVIGSTQYAVNQAKGQYNTARTNAASNNKLGQWWQYSSTNDKIMVAIGIAGLFLVVRSAK